MERYSMKTLFGTLLRDGSTENTEEVDLNQVASSDPIAYIFGLRTGRAGLPEAEKGTRKRELAPEYRRGWKEGTAERKVTHG